MQGKGPSSLKATAAPENASVQTHRTTNYILYEYEYRKLVRVSYIHTYHIYLLYRQARSHINSFTHCCLSTAVYRATHGACTRTGTNIVACSLYTPFEPFPAHDMPTKLGPCKKSVGKSAPDTTGFQRTNSMEQSRRHRRRTADLLVEKTEHARVELGLEVFEILRR